MKELKLEQMERITGGSSRLECGVATVGLVIAYGGLFVATGGLGLAFAAAGAIIAPTSWGLTCFGSSTRNNNYAVIAQPRLQ
ncbi:MAG: hypothetical protein AAGI25_19570 [Bacteroidota bacterium]